MIGERPQLRREDDHLVAEPHERLADCEEVHLGAARGDQMAVPEYEAQPAQPIASARGRPLTRSG
jgi:hypothetical protein